MKKKYFLLIILIFSFSFLTPDLNAQSPTSENDIQKIREVIQQKVQQKLQEISSENIINPKKAYLGTITKIENQNLSFNSKDQKYDFIISDDATFINQKQNKIKITDLKEGQDALILTLAKDEIVYAKRIILVDPTKLENKKNIALGKIADVSTTTSIFVLIPLNNNSRELQMKIDSQTEIVTRDNKSLKFTDLKKGQKIVCIYTNGQNSTYPTLKIISLD